MERPLIIFMCEVCEVLNSQVFEVHPVLSYKNADEMKDFIILSGVDAWLYIRHVNVRMLMKANAMNMYLLDTLS